MVHDSLRCRYSPYRSRHGWEHTVTRSVSDVALMDLLKTTIDQLETTV